MCSLNWQEPDRVPLQIYLTPEMEQKLQNHFKGRDLYECLGIDFRTFHPPYLGKVKPPQGDIHFGLWGEGYRPVSHGAAGTYAEACVLPLAELETMDDVQKYPWPDPEAFDYSSITDFCEKNKNYAICICGAGHPDIVNGVSRCRGMEQVLMDIALRDEVGLAIIDKRVDFCYTQIRRCLEAAKGKVDIVCLGEDCGNQNGRMFGPKDWNEIFVPRLKKFYDLAHEFGCKAMMHSCGDTHEIMPSFIEMGLDILDAMQPEPKGMAPETIRGMCKGKLAFCGLISTQDTLPFKSEADCRREARHRIDVIAKGGGYIFSPAHCIQPDTPLENVLAIYEEALGVKLS